MLYMYRKQNKRLVGRIQNTAAKNNVPGCNLLVAVVLEVTKGTLLDRRPSGLLPASRPLHLELAPARLRLRAAATSAAYAEPAAHAAAKGVVGHHASRGGGGGRLLGLRRTKRKRWGAAEARLLRLGTCNASPGRHARHKWTSEVQKIHAVTNSCNRVRDTAATPTHQMQAQAGLRIHQTLAVGRAERQTQLHQMLVVGAADQSRTQSCQR